MLCERYEAALAKLLLPVASYHPFPTASERAGWEALPETLRRAALALGEGLLGYQWPALPATLYMECFRNGNRSHYEGPCFARRQALSKLVIAECVEGRGRFLDDIANGVWAICEETSWVVPAHNSPAVGRDGLPDVTEPCIDLFAGETAGLLSWTHYLLEEQLGQVSRLLAPRVRVEVTTRVLDPFLARDDFWWMGTDPATHLNNWSPWCASNCLTAFLLLEPDSVRRVEAVAKAMRIVDRWLATYSPDGGCDEGPSYWGVAGGSLYDCLELLASASHGKVSVFDAPLIQEIGRYIYRAHISGDYYLNFADCPAKVGLSAELVYRYGRRIGDVRMAAQGAATHQQRGPNAGLGGNLLRTLPRLFFTEGIDEPAAFPFVRDVWLDGTQVMAAREQEGSDRGLYLAAKAGHNAESHNHNDVGHFSVYSDGQPVLIDVGVGTYTAQTFSARRYEIWTMQSAYHNLPTVSGVQQEPGRDFRASDVAYHMAEDEVQFSQDIAKAYPAAAGLTTWRRTCKLARGAKAQVEVTDQFALAAPTDDVMLSLMTPCAATVTAGEVLLPCSGHAVVLRYDASALDASVETMEMDDARLRDLWGERLYRIVLRAKTPVQSGTWRMVVERE